MLTEVIWGSFAVLVYMGSDMPLYAFSLFLPSIINELGKLFHPRKASNSF